MTVPKFIYSSQQSHHIEGHQKMKNSAFSSSKSFSRVSHHIQQMRSCWSSRDNVHCDREEYLPSCATSIGTMLGRGVTSFQAAPILNPVTFSHGCLLLRLIGVFDNRGWGRNTSKTIAQKRILWIEENVTVHYHPRWTGEYGIHLLPSVM